MVSSLVIQATGACAGHPCDQCRICQGRPPGGKDGRRMNECPGVSPRCCRRDNPDYQLPAEGDWDGPIFGRIGSLTHVGDTVECHVCGKSFANLASHALGSHNLTAAEYKAIFGLKVTTGLWGAALRDLNATNIRAMIARGAITTIDKRPEDAPTPEQISAFHAGRQRRREEREHMDSPEVREKIATGVSLARGGKKSMTCVICGTVVKRYWANRTKTCGDACRFELISRSTRGKPKSLEARQKLSETRKRMFAEGALKPSPGRRTDDRTGAETALAILASKQP